MMKKHRIYFSICIGLLISIPIYIWLKRSADEQSLRSTSIHEAATMGDTETLQLYFRKHPSFVNTRNEMGVTPLTCAAAVGREEAVRLLLAHGADPNAKSIRAKNWPTGFRRGLWEYFEYDIEGATALHRAAIKGQVGVVDILLQHSTEINAITKTDGATALHYAVFFGHKPVVEALLTAGANSSLKDAAGYTALQWAKERGRKEIENVLRQHGAKE